MDEVNIEHVSIRDFFYPFGQQTYSSTNLLDFRPGHYSRYLGGHAQMTSAPTGGEGVTQNMTKTDMREGGGSLVLTSYLDHQRLTTSTAKSLSCAWHFLPLKTKLWRNQCHL